MRYSTIVEKDDRTLLEIIDMLEQFEKERFIAGLQMRHNSTFQIAQTLDMVRSYQSRLNIEARALVNFSECFIQQFMYQLPARGSCVPSSGSIAYPAFASWGICRCQKRGDSRGERRVSVFYGRG